MARTEGLKTPSERLRELFGEVELLLNHLQRLPETRIPKLFEPTFNERSRLDGTPVPPTNDIQYFMNRLTAISVTLNDSDGFRVSHSGCSTPNLKQNDPGPQLEDYGFLLWARDFLAAVTFPASVDTIKVTRAYRESRAHSVLERLVNWPPSRLSKDQTSTASCTQTDTVYLRYGRMLATEVRHYYLFTFFLILLTIWASVLVFSGRVLMRENDALRADQSAQVTRLGEIERDEHDAFLVTKKAEAEPQPMPCPSEKGGKDVGMRDAGLSISRQHFCERQTTLREREKDLTQMQKGWTTYAYPLVVFMRAPSKVMVENPNGPPIVSLYSHRFSLEMMVDGLLGSILPAAYACLGALASLFRRIGRKVEDETLGPADIGGMRISLILGILTGTVVGLFSDVLNWGDKGSAPLGTTALALLAGFASERVFVMLDGVAERVFGHSEQDPPGRGAKVKLPRP